MGTNFKSASLEQYDLVQGKDGWFSGKDSDFDIEIELVGRGFYHDARPDAILDAEKDIFQLRTKYLEKMRSNQIKEAKAEIIKYERLIKRCRGDKKELLTILDVADNFTSNAYVEEQSRKLSRMCQDLNQRVAQIEKILDRTKETADHVSSTLRRFMNERLRRVDAYGETARACALEKLISRLENHLYFTKTKGDGIRAQNSVLRQQMTALLSDRASSHSAIIFYKNKSRSIQKEVIDLSETISNLSENRQRDVERARQIENMNMMDVTEFVEKLKNFELDLDMELCGEIGYTAILKQHRQTYLNDPNHHLRVKMRARVKEFRDWYISLRDMIKELQQSAPGAEVEEICERYREIEESNFSKIMRIMDLDRNINDLMLEIDEKREQIERAAILKDYQDRSQKRILAEEGEKLYMNILTSETKKVENRELQQVQRNIIISMQTIISALEIDLEIPLTFKPDIVHADNASDLDRAYRILESRIQDLALKRETFLIKKKLEEGVDLEFANWTKMGNPRTMGGPFVPRIYVAATDVYNGHEGADDQDKRPLSRKKVKPESYLTLKQLCKQEMEERLRNKSQDEALNAQSVYYGFDADNRSSLFAGGSVDTTSVRNSEIVFTLDGERPEPTEGVITTVAYPKENQVEDSEEDRDDLIKDI